MVVEYPATGDRRQTWGEDTERIRGSENLTFDQLLYVRLFGLPSNLDENKHSDLSPCIPSGTAAFRLSLLSGLVMNGVLVFFFFFVVVVLAGIC